MLPVFLAQEKVPEVSRGHPTLQKRTVADARGRHNVMSSECSHSEHWVALARGRLFLAGRMTGGFRTVSVLPPGDTGTKSDGTDPRPGYSSAGWHPGAVKDDLNSEENTQCQARDFGYFHSSKADCHCMHSMCPRECDNSCASLYVLVN